MLLTPFYNGVFLLPASHMLSTGRAGEPSFDKLEPSVILPSVNLRARFISFCLCTLITEYINDEGFMKKVHVRLYFKLERIQVR